MNFLSNSDAVTVSHIDAHSNPMFSGHEEVVRFEDQQTGLTGFVSIHNSNLGPAVGGTRYAVYQSESDALRDSLRLSRAMTYKCAMAGVPYGGGKAVLMKLGNSTEKSDAYFAAYARVLATLQHTFYTGEDVGLTEVDIQTMERTSDRIIGRPSVGGLPAQWAAHSVFKTMESALDELYGSHSFAGRIVIIKGLGGVGEALVGLLSVAGATVLGAEINEDRAQMVQQAYPSLRRINVPEILSTECDIYAPCALGDEFSESGEIVHAKIICGAANNQLATPKAAELLHNAGILYVPDYVANAGGLISVVEELADDGYSEKRVIDKINKLGHTASMIFERSRAQNVPTSYVADRLAEERFIHHA